MFAYCTERLHLSEAEAYLRIAAARASREHPVLLTMLADGRLHLTAMAKLAPHLTLENRAALLDRAVHRSKREIEELVAELVPRPDAPALMRKLPSARRPTLQLRPDGVAVVDAECGVAGLQAVRSEPRPDRVVTPPELRPDAVATVEPLSPARYRVQFTASAQLHDKLERLRALMRSKVPDGDLAAIIEEAVTEKLERLEARRFAKIKDSPSARRDSLSARDTSPSTRHVPAAVRRAVYARDGGRCRYEDGHGRRCTAREGLELHHRRPFGFGGDHSVHNIALACRAHNRYLAEVDYGRKGIAPHRQTRKPGSPHPSTGCAGTPG
jgi:5-methylcytosine-specific restriction endonuclease McrA